MADDRALRKMVKSLIALPQDHFNAVMDGLDHRQRTIVSEVIEGLNSENEKARNPEPLFKDLLIPNKLSPWLVERISNSYGGIRGVNPRFAITEKTIETLQECANDVRAKSLILSETIEPPTSLFGRFWGRRESKGGDVSCH